MASDNDQQATINQPTCCFIVTGFGPFCGVPDNPTSILIRRLRNDNDSKTLHSLNNISETHILETSAEHVREKMDDIYERLKSPEHSVVKQAKANCAASASAAEEANLFDEKKKVVVLMHLGVNYKGKSFQLEQCAYNDATFRVPDERGYQPNRQCILEGSKSASSHGWGKCFSTTLGLQSICEELQPCNEVVSISTDPGRFVCNYTYCLSLDRCQTINQYDLENKEEEIHALFIHVPPFEVVSEDRQLDFILKVMDAIERQFSGVAGLVK